MNFPKTAMLTAALAVAFCSAAFGQTLEEKRDKKLASEFLKKATWILDYDKAREEAKKSNKPIFALFTRSYAYCPPCHALESGPLMTDDFASFAKGYVLFCHVTTQIPGEKYGELLQEKGGQGFPHLVFMDAEGNVLAVHESERTPAEFAKTGEKARSFVDLKAKAAAGDKKAKIDFLILQLEMGQLKADEAKKQLADAGELNAEQKAKVEGSMVNSSILDDVKAITSEEQAKTTATKFYEMQKSGKPGPTADQAMQPYYILGMNAAAEAKDADTFEKNLKILKGKFGDNPQAKRFFEANEKKLADMKASPKGEEKKEEPKKEEKK